MLTQYFGFKEEPFGATPDPRWLYRSSSHREALASLKYGFYTNRGFTALIAPPGYGKTTLLFQFLHDIWNSARCVFLFDTQAEPLGLLRYILRDLGVTPAATGDEMHGQLQEVVLQVARAGRKVVIVVDEAQNLTDEALEMLRLLTNFESPRAKLLQIVLSGQPSLADRLTTQLQEPLRQRVSTIGLLQPFSMDETTAYVRHRLEKAGYRGAPLFRKDALKRILIASRGNPRLINNLCFNALSLCCALKRKQVDGSMAAKVIADQQQVRQSTEAVALQEAAEAEAPLQSLGVLEPEQSRPPEQIVEAEEKKPAPGARRLQSLGLLKPEPGPQAEERKPAAWAEKLLIPAAAVLLAAVGLGLVVYSGHWQSGPRAIDPRDSRDTKALSQSTPESGPVPVTPTTTNITVTELPPEDMALTAGTQSTPGAASTAASGPEPGSKSGAGPAKPDTSNVAATEPVAQTKPSPAKRRSASSAASAQTPKAAAGAARKAAVLFPPASSAERNDQSDSTFAPGFAPGSAPVRANTDQVAVVQPSARGAPSAGMALTARSPAPALRNIGAVAMTQPPSKAQALALPTPAPFRTKPGTVNMALPPSNTAPAAANGASPSPAPAMANIGKVGAEPSGKATPSATRALSPPIAATSSANMGKVTDALPAAKAAPSAAKAQPARSAAPGSAAGVGNTGRAAAAQPAANIKAFQITVGPNETLREICVRYLGGWDERDLHKIQALNPNLTDWDHLQAGQKIWLPGPMAPNTTLLATGDGDDP